MDGTFKLVDDADGRYRLLVAGEEVGFIEYDPVGHDSILIKHTEVATEHEGKGYGSQLVRRALDDMRSRHKTVIPICPYALAWIRRHREYADLVREDMRSRL
jgi:predicted GNAT family acetyltransferase